MKLANVREGNVYLTLVGNDWVVVMVNRKMLAWELPSLRLGKHRQFLCTREDTGGTLHRTAAALRTIAGSS